ncbi:hypothetical protein OIU79_012810 [Salix purpurea]|uniref:Uncharacterized protein n=1 Tax=Salix purpurea TaxID=77065 RepID=A0A9Q0Q4H4_SALPP|nr:hypothetical protein OIU79_012810 [Salix purpurea]
MSPLESIGDRPLSLKVVQWRFPSFSGRRVALAIPELNYIFSIALSVVSKVCACCIASILTMFSRFPCIVYS